LSLLKPWPGHETPQPPQLETVLSDVHEKLQHAVPEPQMLPQLLQFDEVPSAVQTLLQHAWLEQSELMWQDLLLEQAGHEPPPQSTSVSVPFLTLSEQVAAWQMPLRQTPLWQSELAMHPLPVPQVGHEPPQSMSVSVPFFTPSVHDGVAQRPP
jgi:hypothetical protein